MFVDNNFLSTLTTETNNITDKQAFTIYNLQSCIYNLRNN